jgi:hypothetical protein
MIHFMAKRHHGTLHGAQAEKHRTKAHQTRPSPRRYQSFFRSNFLHAV